MSLEETEPEPHNVCVKCFWEEEAKQRNKKYVHRFNLFASWITLDLTITQKEIPEKEKP